MQCTKCCVRGRLRIRHAYDSLSDLHAIQILIRFSVQFTVQNQSTPICNGYPILCLIFCRTPARKRRFKIFTYHLKFGKRFLMCAYVIHATYVSRPRMMEIGHRVGKGIVCKIGGVSVDAHFWSRTDNRMRKHPIK
jgi:hypothetical protein